MRLVQGDRSVVKGDEMSAGLITKTEKGKRPPEIFGVRRLGLSLEGRNEIVRRLLESEAPDTVRRQALNEWELGDEAATSDSLSRGPPRSPGRRPPG